MDGGKHREILDEKLLKAAEDLKKGTKFTFQQQNPKLRNQGYYGKKQNQLSIKG